MEGEEGKMGGGGDGRKKREGGGAASFLPSRYLDLGCQFKLTSQKRQIIAYFPVYKFFNNCDKMNKQC